MNTRISFESVLMLFTKIIKISPCLWKLQLAKVGAFFETQCSAFETSLQFRDPGAIGRTQLHYYKVRNIITKLQTHAI